MKPGYSKLLLHEQLLPENDASMWAVTQDFSMLTQMATGERTADIFRAIIEKAGLDFVRVWKSDDNVSESVIEARCRVE